VIGVKERARERRVRHHRESQDAERPQGSKACGQGVHDYPTASHLARKAGAIS